MAQTMTMTQPASALKLSSFNGMPQKIADLLAKHPKLTHEQCGHLRHIHNIISTLDGVWLHMGDLEGAQD
jgi:hypothetical protein